MASEKLETVVDIAAEKRERAQAIRKSLSVVPYRRDSQIAEAEELESDADRIEAAWERESKAIATENAVLPAVCITNRGNGDVAAKRGRESITPNPDPEWKAICAKCHDGEIEPDCEYYGEPNGCNSPIYGEHPTTEKSSAVGDTAAMRDALERTDLFLSALGKWLKVNDEGQEYALSAGVIHTLVKHALAKPPRNCDDGTAEEQIQRWANFCCGERNCRTCPCEGEFDPFVKCFAKWGQMPYEGGESDGSK